MSGPLRLVASDLDGTLLGTDGQISVENLAALRVASERGVQVVIATGRPIRRLFPIEPLAPLHPLVLASNGAVRYDLVGQRVLSSDSIAPELLRTLIADIAAADPSASFAVEHLGGFAHEPAYPTDETLPAGMRCAERPDLVDEHGAVKLLARSTNWDSDRFGALVTQVAAGRCEVTWSWIHEHGLLEIAPAGVTKGSGLQVMLDDLGIDPAQAAAFGDMPNDLQMLQLVGKPFAMADSHPSLAAAGFPRAGGHDESGVGRALLALLESEH